MSSGASRRSKSLQPRRAVASLAATSGQQDQRDTSGIREPPSADLMFLIKGQLLAEKQILGGQRRSGGNTSSQKPDSIEHTIAENSGSGPNSLEDFRASVSIIASPSLRCGVRDYSPTFVELSFIFRAIVFAEDRVFSESTLRNKKGPALWKAGP